MPPGIGSSNDSAYSEAMLAIASLAWREGIDEGVHRTVAAPPSGRFEGLPPHVALLDEGRKVQLLKPLAFVHHQWSPWPVPAGTIADGASIPRPFWSLIGGPFEGRYRNASIVHDHYCDTRNRPWRDVHRMFYEAMLTGGVGQFKAKIMYYAVYRFGPRWLSGDELPQLDQQGAAPSPAPLAESQADGLVRDAEAIYFHDLDIDEIDALADARNAEAPGGLEGPGSAELERARRLVVVGGSAGPADLEAVAANAAFLPAYLLQRFERIGVRIVACRGSVTDFERDLRGVVPRGWDRTGKTWDDVPGAFFPDRKRVVIATIAAGADRAVPTKASRLHGSADLVVHESMHGYDYVGGHAVLRDQRYVSARLADFERLGPYERQEGMAGLEESFAESGARHAVQPDVLQSDWPHLFAYWEAGPAESIEIPESPLESVQEPDAPIGIAEMRSDGTLEMDLRAEGPGGAVGHAWMSVAPTDTDYDERKQWLLGGLGPEEAAGEPFLIRP